ncbi:ArsR/SmtB family transcription factor [Streptomyces sp. NPDC059071]|uniref:ArsR/SmtB family transcription factor n=1 Tax=unclassified Streptomyces TaxID=2593676 RepID=UPI00366A3BE3
MIVGEAHRALLVRGLRAPARAFTGRAASPQGVSFSHPRIGGGSNAGRRREADGSAAETGAKAVAKAAPYDACAAGGKAPAGGKRLELPDLLAQGDDTVDALAKAAGLHMTTASAHPQTLKQTGFVATRREGVRIRCRLAGDHVARLFPLLREVADRHQAAVPAARSACLCEDAL